MMSDVDEKKVKSTNFEDSDIADLLEKTLSRPFMKRFSFVIVFINIWIVAFGIMYAVITFAIDYIDIGSVPVVLLPAVLSFLITLIAIARIG